MMILNILMIHDENQWFILMLMINMYQTCTLRKNLTTSRNDLNRGRLKRKKLKIVKIVLKRIREKIHARASKCEQNQAMQKSQVRLTSEYTVCIWRGLAVP
jgi:hypothetical protein